MSISQFKLTLNVKIYVKLRVRTDKFAIESIAIIVAIEDHRALHIKFYL